MNDFRDRNMIIDHEPITPGIVSLPTEVKRLTASFLSPRDALNFAETCKTVHSQLSLCLVRNSHLLFTKKAYAGDWQYGLQEVPLMHIPCLNQRVHSIRLTFRWRDQGWGNTHSCVWIIGRKRNTPPNPRKRFYGGRIVWKSRRALHNMTDCEVTFVTNPTEEIYQLWFRVGGGGGHELHLHDGRLHTLMFDDEKSMSRIHQSLQTAGAIPLHNAMMSKQASFYSQFLLHAFKALRAQHDGSYSQQETPNGSFVEQSCLTSFFEKLGIPITEKSLSTLEEILKSDFEQALPQIFGPVDEEERHQSIGTIGVAVMDMFGERNLNRHYYGREDRVEFDNLGPDE